MTGPQAYTYEDENNNSLCLQIRYEQFSCLLTGDAEREAEHDMVASGQDLACDVYVVGHHGSASSTGDELLRAAAPTCAFLSVGAGNLYGHPAEQTLAALRRQGTALYRTDVQGEVTVFSDGQQCWFSTVPCEDWRAGTGTAAEEPLSTVPPQNAHYLLNTHTQKFHSPDCPSGEQMKEENKAFTDATREELIARGYTPCGRCNP